jgi:hypothetical protein
MADHALAWQAGWRNPGLRPDDSEASAALLDEFNVRFFAAADPDQLGRFISPLVKTAGALPTPRMRIDFWTDALRIAPPRSRARSYLLRELALQLGSVEIGDYESAVDAMEEALSVDFGMSAGERQQYDQCRRELGTFRSLRDERALVGVLATPAPGRLLTLLRNRSVHSVALPSAMDGDVQVWVDCISGGVVLDSHLADILEPVASSFPQSLAPGEEISISVGDPGCRPGSDKSRQLRVLLFPTADADRFSGTIFVSDKLLQ